MYVRLTFVALLTVAAFTGCIASVETSPQLVLESRWGGDTIEGEVRNVGTTDADCVSIEFVLEDATGSTVSLVSAQSGPVKAGEKWEFHLSGNAPGTTQVRNSSLRTC